MDKDVYLWGMLASEEYQYSSIMNMHACLQWSPSCSVPNSHWRHAYSSTTSYSVLKDGIITGMLCRFQWIWTFVWIISQSYRRHLGLIVVLKSLIEGIWVRWESLKIRIHQEIVLMRTAVALPLLESCPNLWNRAWNSLGWEEARWCAQRCSKPELNKEPVNHSIDRSEEIATECEKFSAMEGWCRQLFEYATRVSADEGKREAEWAEDQAVRCQQEQAETISRRICVLFCLVCAFYWLKQRILM